MDLIKTLSALGLGTITSLHPCLIILNITALTAICGPMRKTAQMIFGTASFILGRTLSYVIIGSLIAAGALAAPETISFLKYYFTEFLGPLCIIVGMIISGMFGKSISASPLLQVTPGRGILHLGSLCILGAIHAVSFCPSSAGIYFGVLLPMASNPVQLLALNIFYGIGTGIPILVMVITAMGGKKVLIRQQKYHAAFEFWFPKITGGLLILLGIYLTLERVFEVW